MEAVRTDERIEDVVIEGPWDYAHYAMMPEDSSRTYEVIRGYLCMTPPPTVGHQRVTKRLFVEIERYVAAHGLGEVFFSPLGVQLSDKNVLEPDLLFVSKDREDILGEIVVEGAPDLVVEVLSPSTATLDREDKRVLYGQYRVREYWIVDPTQQIIEQYLLERDRLQLQHVLELDQVLQSAVIEGLRIKLSEIWA